MPYLRDDILRQATIQFILAQGYTHWGRLRAQSFFAQRMPSEEELLRLVDKLIMKTNRGCWGRYWYRLGGTLGPCIEMLVFIEKLDTDPHVHFFVKFRTVLWKRMLTSRKAGRRYRYWRKYEGKSWAMKAEDLILDVTFRKVWEKLTGQSSGVWWKRISDLGSDEQQALAAYVLKEADQLDRYHIMPRHGCSRLAAQV